MISDEGVLVDRYDKQFCSNTELTRFYTPGTRPAVFEVDGFRVGLALCIEINFPDLFAVYERLGVDCLLVSAFPVDSIFETKARAHAAVNNYWVGLSVPAQSTHHFPSGMVGPDGEHVLRLGADEQVGVAVLDRADPAYHVPLQLARPWRRLARAGAIYDERKVNDPRSDARTSF